MSALPLVLLSPELVRFRGTRFQGGEKHVLWKVAAARVDDFDGRSLLPLSAFLHAGGANGWAEVEVAALIANAEGLEDDAFEETLKASDAIETLYDFARNVLWMFLGAADADVQLDYKAPPVEVERFDLDAAVDNGEDNAEEDTSEAIAAVTRSSSS